MEKTTSSYRRARVNRDVRRALAEKEIAAAVGPITPGCEIYGLSKGQFSLVDLLVYSLKATGSADVIVSTWTAAGADIEFAYKLLTEGTGASVPPNPVEREAPTIRSLKFMVDFSFPSRQPAYCAALRERFGDDAIRVTKNHAKFITIRNERWNLVIRTSMNLNENRRLESFEISDDAGMADYLAEVVALLFDAETGAEALAKRPIEHCRAFEALAESGLIDESAIMRSTDTKKYFGDGPFSNDLRRAGVSYSKGGVQ